MADNLFEMSLLSNEEAGLEPEPGEQSLEEGKEPEAKKEAVKTKEEKTPVKEEKKEEASKELELLSAKEAGLKEEELGEDGAKPVKVKKSDIASVLSYKDIADYMIKEGEWLEPNEWDKLKETIDWNPETFGEFQKQQDRARLANILEEERGSFGTQYSELLKYAKEGGKFEDLMPSFQQQIEIESLDPNNVEQAEQIIESECEAKGWSKKRIDSYLESLKDRGEDTVKETATEAKASLVESITEDRAERLKNQELQSKADKQKKDAFDAKVRETLLKDEESTERERKENFEFYLKHKYQDEAGNKYSEMDKSLIEIKNNPVKFAKYVQLIKDFDKVGKIDKVEKEVKKNVFQFLRSSQTDLGSKTTEEISPKKQKIIHWDFASA